MQLIIFSVISQGAFFQYRLHNELRRKFVTDEIGVVFARNRQAIRGRLLAFIGFNLLRGVLLLNIKLRIENPFCVVNPCVETMSHTAPMPLLRGG
jgi:hypothetical protein